MSKKFNRHNTRDEFEDDLYEDRVYHNDLKQRRKMKRMKNALKSKNIDALMRDLDDDYDMY